MQEESILLALSGFDEKRIEVSNELQNSNSIYQQTYTTDDAIYNGNNDSETTTGTTLNFAYQYAYSNIGNETNIEENVTDSRSEAGSDSSCDLDDVEALQLESESIAAAERLSQENASKHVPLLGMKFKTDKEDYGFYNDYGFIIGFSITKWSTYPCKDKKDPNFGKITRRTYKCNMYGRVNGDKKKTVAPGVQELRKGKQKNQTPPTPSAFPKKRKTSGIVHTQCPAEMIVTFIEGMWTITRINLDHNHPLAARDQKVCLCSQTKMTEMEKKLIRIFSDVNIEDKKIMAILTYIRGGTAPYKKKYVSNMKTTIRKECSQNDMPQVLELFLKIQDEEPLFYYTFNVEHKTNKVKNIF